LEAYDFFPDNFFSSYRQWLAQRGALVVVLLAGHMGYAEASFSSFCLFLLNVCNLISLLGDLHDIDNFISHRASAAMSSKVCK